MKIVTFKKRPFCVFFIVILLLLKKFIQTYYKKHQKYFFIEKISFFIKIMIHKQALTKESLIC